MTLLTSRQVVGSTWLDPATTVVGLSHVTVKTQWARGSKSLRQPEVFRLVPQVTRQDLRSSWPKHRHPRKQVIPMISLYISGTSLRHWSSRDCLRSSSVIISLFLGTSREQDISLGDFRTRMFLSNFPGFITALRTFPTWFIVVCGARFGVCFFASVCLSIFHCFVMRTWFH